MYTITNPKPRINNILKFLNKQQNGKIEETDRLIIKDIQNKAGITSDGVVNYQTFTLLYNEYNKSKLRNLFNDGLIRYNNMPYSLGSKGNDVAYLNALMTSALTGFTHYEKMPSGSYYGRESIEAAKRLRKIFGMKDGENVDEELYLRIRRELKYN